MLKLKFGLGFTNTSVFDEIDEEIEEQNLLPQKLEYEICSLIDIPTFPSKFKT